MREQPIGLSENGEKRKPAPLQEEMISVMRELQQAEEIFNNVTDDNLTEASIYRIRYLTSYRDYLVRMAREEDCGDAARTAVSI